MHKIVSTALLLALAGASAPAFAATLIPGDQGDFSAYSGHTAGAGGPANLYYGARGEVPAQDVRADNWAKCARLYPTFDPRTGTFVGSDGVTHDCQ